jgi:type I restriction enzyme S subunit
MSDDATLDEFTDTSDIKEGRSEEEKSRFWGEIPTDWNLVDGSNIYEVNPNPDPVQQPNTYIEMDALNTELPFPDYFGERNASEYSGKTFTQGDTLFARITPCTENGKAALVPEIETKVGIGSTEFAVLSPKSDIIHPWFLYYLNKSHPVHNYAVSRMRGSTGRQRVPFSVFRKELDFPLPPLSEQRKIATVLHTVDQAIQKTKEVIEQTERTQKGHIRHLFRKGVSDEATETHEVLGEMPTSWKITELSNIADVVMGSSPKSEYYNESGDGLPFYQGNNDFNRRNPTTNVWCTDPVKQAKKGDILISIRAPVGDLNIATEDSCIGRGLAAIRPQSIDFDYLYYHLYERNNWFSRISSGSTFDSINSSQIRNTKIKLPSKSIQEKIGSILRNNELYILKEEEYLNQLQRLKQGLMQDLLSGKVRTIDTDTYIPEEIAKYG